MATIVLRSVKGSPLTNDEVDANFTNLNNAVGSSSYTLPAATTSNLGGIKIGTGLSIDANGVVTSAGSYSLPTATTNQLGGIKVGSNLSIDAAGVLSETGGGGGSGGSSNLDGGTPTSNYGGITAIDGGSP